MLTTEREKARLSNFYLLSLRMFSRIRQHRHQKASCNPQIRGREINNEHCSTNKSHLPALPKGMCR